MFKKDRLLFLLPIMYIVSMTIWVFLSEALFMHLSGEIKLTIQITSRISIVLINGIVLFFICKKYKSIFLKEKETNHTLLTIMNAMPEFIVLKDDKNRWIEANDFSLTFTKQSRETFKGKTDEEIFERKNSCQQTDEKMWEMKKVFKGEECLLNSEGKKVIFDVIKVPLFYVNGEKKGSVVIGRDVSKKKEKEKAIQKSDKLHVIGELAAGIVHEIKNPLTSIQGFIQLVKEEDKDKKHEMYFDILLKEIKKIDFIIEQFLILSKTDEMNKLKKEKIKEIMDEIISLFNQENERKNLIIETNIEDELPFIFCQKNQLKQAFLNLIQNAQEAMEETNGKLLITAKNKKEKKQVHITFKDNGKGISPERLEKLGEPFFTTKEKGIGLGTTISYKIIKQHKGTIHFESEPGKGTTVRVILPYD